VFHAITVYKYTFPSSSLNSRQLAALWRWKLEERTDGVPQEVISACVGENPD